MDWDGLWWGGFGSDLLKVKFCREEGLGVYISCRKFTGT